MADWREVLQDAMYPVLTCLLQEGFVLPLYVTCIGRNGSMMCGRYDDIEATGLNFIVEASHLESEAFLVPIHMLVVDQRVRPDTYAVMARVDRTYADAYLRRRAIGPCHRPPSDSLPRCLT